MENNKELVSEGKKRSDTTRPYFSLACAFRTKRTVASTSWRDRVELVQLYNVVHLLGVSRSCGASLELGKATVKWVLSTLESRSGRSTTARLLSTHTKTTRSTLSGSDTTSLSRFCLARPGGRFEVVQSEFKVVQIIYGALVGLSALPVVQLHG